MGYELPGTRGDAIWSHDPEFHCIGYEAVIDGLKYSTQHADLVCGPKEDPPFGFGNDAPMLWRTKRSKAFFYLFRGKFQLLGERAARDKYQELKYAARMTEAEAFGSETEIA